MVHSCRRFSLPPAWLPRWQVRVWVRVCAGPVHFEPGDELHGEPAGSFHPHAPRLVINAVLIAITVGAVVSIFCANWVLDMVGGSTAAGGIPGEHHAVEGESGWADPHNWMPYVASVIGLVGIGIAWYFHLANRKAADDLKRALKGNVVTAWLPTAMENKWYVDELYHATIRAPLWLLGRILNLFDRYVLDMVFVDGIARLPRTLGRGFQPLANGVLQSYAVSMIGGAGLIAVLVFVMPELMEMLGGWMGGGR